MKLYLKILFFGTLIISLFSCSNSKTTEHEDTEVSSNLESIEPVNIETFEFTKDQLPTLKEQLFYFLRKQILNFDKNTFVKYEDLKINGSQFYYSAIIIEKEMLQILSSTRKEEASFVSFSTYSRQDTNLELGDSIEIKGAFIIDQNGSTVEHSFADVNLLIKAEVTSSFLNASPYSYSEYERINDGYDFEKPLIVKLNEPLLYSKEELYLKARITGLTKQDLAGIPREELAYFRNEIFARHGHSFKTEKMDSYFRSKEWYRPFFTDATSFLNDTEANNVQFIKSLEL